jgi:hypothetical protein
MYIYEYLHILYNKYEVGEDDKCLNWGRAVKSD